MGGAYVDDWVTLDRQTEIRQVDDLPIGTRYLTVRGPATAEVARHIRQDCDLWSTTEAPTALAEATTRDTIVTAVYAAASPLAIKDAPDVIREFRAVANNSDAGIRQSVVIATGYSPTRTWSTWSANSATPTQRTMYAETRHPPRPWLVVSRRREQVFGAVARRAGGKASRWSHRGLCGEVPCRVPRSRRGSPATA